MKVIIFGASGTVGKHLIQQALEQGHEVSTFSRDISKLNEFDHPKLYKIQGDVLHKEAVEKAIIGKEAVIVVLGAGANRKSVVRSIGTQHIIQAMEKTGINRLICQSTLGAGNSYSNLNFFWKYIMFGWFLKPVFLDHQQQERFVTQSNLNWTIVRPGAFTDGPQTKNYQHGFSPSHRSLKLKISRADIAHFILQQLYSNHYLFKSPGLSY